MKVRDVNHEQFGHPVVIIEADDFPAYNGIIGTLHHDESGGVLFFPILRSMRLRGKSLYTIPLKASDIIEPIS
ncbi:MAG: hypothetical protein ACM3S2_06690 [Ignavibacteriales bacterium]